MSIKARRKVIRDQYIATAEELVSLGGIYLQSAYQDATPAPGYIV